MNTPKNALVVGGTAGIGRETARLLAQAGYRLLLVGRNAPAGQALAGELNGVFMRADVSLMREVRRVAAEVRANAPSLDLIIHTADVLLTRRQETEEGFEVSIATNYYGRFLLNHLLLNEEPRYRPSRVIHVAAAGFPPGKSFRQKFPIAADASSFTGHGIGQVANDFYGLTLADQLRGQPTKVNILNPGIVDTEIRRGSPGFPGWLKAIEPVLGFFLRPFTKTPQQYAQLVRDVALGRNAAANQSVLLNRHGKPINPAAPLLDKDLRAYVWQRSRQELAL